MERRAIQLEGIVQGVGFRPYVHHLATRLELTGFVRNETGSVLIEVEGHPSEVDRFLTQLLREPPPLARIEHVSWSRQSLQGDSAFEIKRSQVAAEGPIYISPDVATCPECRRELRDPSDRRYGYPFLNCTQCGPRLTIITGAPYDRLRTTMAGFEMCAECRAEYENPSDRRFHAQPIACARCGPRLSLHRADGSVIATDDPLAAFADALRQGGIGALKGLGGFHLACDARSNAAVSLLRARKHRDEKPFAVTVADLEIARSLCEIDAAEEALLTSPRAPIVLLRRRADARIASGVAPGNPSLGIMLPYTPLHHLLVRQLGDVPLVMTSGNRSDEPMAYENKSALEQLRGIADLFLLHDRPIRVRCDDSVVRVAAGGELPLRRSRGYAPEPVALPVTLDAPILAVGGQLKGTFGLGRQRGAFLSHHLGDLDHLAAYQAFERDVVLYEELFGIRPQIIAHDLHPEYASTHYATARAERERLRLVAVQHHHAHLASCLAEHGRTQPAIGVILDGTGYGTDGAIWGGEFLVGDLRGFQRSAHLRYTRMPGGERAIREPWRLALAHLVDADVDPAILGGGVSTAQIRTIRTMLDRGVNSPQTSSMGRLFDAVAALAAVRTHVSYEGQAAIELEWLATNADFEKPYPFDVRVSPGCGTASQKQCFTQESAPVPNTASAKQCHYEPPTSLQIDVRQMIRAVAADVRSGVEPRRIARRFHTTITEIIVGVCARIRDYCGLESVVLSGGVFMNVLLLTESSERLRSAGFEVLRHRRVPPNDGGLSLGQLAVAATVVGQAVPDDRHKTGVHQSDSPSGGVVGQALPDDRGQTPGRPTPRQAQPDLQE
ncbi:MAG TPA: carbamoyltransferase HypF [Planctomycetaceae bacterium]|nr:carbamoyltransferase HypF [Planctomycetaceae bacterium]